MDEETIRQIHQPEGERTLEPREALAVCFAEKLAGDFRSADAAFRDELAQHFSAEEIAELAFMIGQYVAMGRMLVFSGGDKAACEIYVPDY